MKLGPLEKVATWICPTTARGAEKPSENEPKDSVCLDGEKEKPVRFKSKTWAFTERLVDKDPHLDKQRFHPSQVQKNPEIVKAFGSKTPNSQEVLLHYAGDPPRGVERKETPVLLVHGAIKDGNFWWDPSEDGKNQGLPQRLREQGFSVYALTFAHNQDDNFLQAEQIANCIDRIKELTGKDEVDLVAHSKGGTSARIYASDVKQEWMTPYRGDVRRLVLVGAANGGIDTLFRHPMTNLASYYNDKLNAPMSWENVKYFGVFPHDVKDQNMSKDGADYWPGQRQLLARWDSKYPISFFEPDALTTYYGGHGVMSKSKGIDHYIQEGGNVIERLNSTKMDPEIEVALLAGDSPSIPGIINEYAGPSDGLVFVDSALTMPSTDNIVAKSVIHQHHKALVSSEEGQNWIADVLSKP